MIDDRRAALVERLEDAAGYASKEHAAIMREAAADLDLIRAEVDRMRAALYRIAYGKYHWEADAQEEARAALDYRKMEGK